MAAVTSDPASRSGSEPASARAAEGRPRSAARRDASDPRRARSPQTAAPPVPIRKRISSLVIERQLIERLARLRGCAIETIEAERDSSEGPLPVEQAMLALALSSVAALHGIALSPHQPAVAAASYYLDDATALLSEQLGLRLKRRRKG
jgi:hypothetical protein